MCAHAAVIGEAQEKGMQTQDKEACKHTKNTNNEKNTDFSHLGIFFPPRQDYYCTVFPGATAVQCAYMQDKHGERHGKVGSILKMSIFCQNVKIMIFFILRKHTHFEKNTDFSQCTCIHSCLSKYITISQDGLKKYI